MSGTPRLRIDIVAAFIGFALGGLALAKSVSHRGGDIRIGVHSDREHLHEIAVPSSACPPLGRRRVTALAVSDGWWRQLGSDGPPWRDFARQLGPKLDRFAAALHAAIPNVPPPVDTRLEKVLTEVAIGQHHRRGSTSAAGYVVDTNLAVFKGEQALLDASDLTGDACGPLLCDDTTPNIST